ncbi:unannotated protein [freshwater metagenome]|uniref:Unannotated protein n=1 Tax=freshwater metagenome TaxID=449393 RepID=A0A6J6QKJ8_9ZZZZ
MASLRGSVREKPGALGTPCFSSKFKCLLQWAGTGCPRRREVHPFGEHGDIHGQQLTAREGLKCRVIGGLILVARDTQSGPALLGVLV